LRYLSEETILILLPVVRLFAVTPKIQVYAVESNDTHAGGCTQALHKLWLHLQTQELISPNAFISKRRVLAAISPLFLTA
jgi:hypothetical protein